MKYSYITFRSITFGQQGERLLRKNGIHTSLQRTPRWMEQKGCGYRLQLSPPEVYAAVKLLRENRVDFRKVYQRTDNGALEEQPI